MDTHIWIWWMLGDPSLRHVERDALDALPAETRPVLCDISLGDFATLVDLGRVEIEGTVEDWLRVAASPSTVTIQPITPGIVAEMNRLPAATISVRFKNSPSHHRLGLQDLPLPWQADDPHADALTHNKEID